jgi:predicted protein tyrosine phosphatase
MKILILNASPRRKGVTVLDIPDSYNFAKKKQKYLEKARNIGISI